VKTGCVLKAQQQQLSHDSLIFSNGRSKMLKSIPEYHFKNIEINDLITKQNSSKSNTV